ncbi:Protein BFR2 [Cladobotryum mycophilum]|uniref:Protein BFR2 n=1 Tax=Cladobotryum mycophilum TaxID=491253 RepID=A0ABR0SSV8_9HYPO
MVKPKGRAKEFQDPDEKNTKDYDPEANGHDSDNGSGSELSDDENAGTEHYVTVGKSKLREKEGVALGKQYRGSRVSRQALEDESEEDDDDEEEEEEESGSDGDEEYDDPETADLAADTAEANDSEIESDNALAKSDEEQLKEFVFRGSSKPKKSRKRASAADYMSSSDEEETAGGADVSDEDMSGAELDGSEEDEDMDDGLDALVNGGDSSDEEASDAEEDESQSGEDDDEEDDGSEEEDDEDENQDAKPSLAGPSSNQSEVQKGIAIQEQRKIYDGLLNMRIRLQKALVAANTFPTLEDSSTSESEAYEAAEEAAIKLLNTISGLRQNMAPSTVTGGKRKRIIEGSATSAEIWEQMQEEDQNSTKFREDRLEKWSRKVQSVNVVTAKLGVKQKTLISALQEQLTTPESRLIKRTRVPRSCAPVQAAKKIAESEDIYDDADFYQLLLKELVDQRTVESAAEQNSAVASVMVNANKEAKMRKVVDRKASKGRKMRFTVHEKLQNFMAPEDRRSWEQEAIDRFFGTLFGQKMELNEEESEDDEMDELYNKDEGLRLFR